MSSDRQAATFTPGQRLPLHKAYFSAAEAKAAAAVIATGQVAGDQAFCHQAEERLRALTGSPSVLLTNSGTAALELALMACDLEPGDEVILPSFTFTSTATAIVQQRAVPVFVDCELVTGNIIPEQVEAAVTERTRAVMVVHYAGQACRMDEIRAIARRHQLPIIEDAAHGVGAAYHGQALGTLGDFGCYSFHESKNVVCGEGGCLLCADLEAGRRVELFREKGTNRSAFFRGEIDKYTWVERGSSYVLSEIQAAILNVQLDKWEEILAERRRVAQGYNELLAGCADIIPPRIEPFAETNWHIYFVRVPRERRGRVLAEMKQRQIGATFHFLPLHLSPGGQRFGRVVGELRHTVELSESLIRLPIYPDLPDAAVEYIATALKAAVAA